MLIVKASHGRLVVSPETFFKYIPLMKGEWNVFVGVVDEEGNYSHELRVNKYFTFLNLVNKSDACYYRAETLDGKYKVTCQA